MRDAVRRLAEEDAEMVRRWEEREEGGGEGRRDDEPAAADVAAALPAQLDRCMAGAELDVSLTPQVRRSSPLLQSSPAANVRAREPSTPTPAAGSGEDSAQGDQRVDTTDEMPESASQVRFEPFVILFRVLV